MSQVRYTPPEWSIKTEPPAEFDIGITHTHTHAHTHTHNMLYDIVILKFRRNTLNARGSASMAQGRSAHVRLVQSQILMPVMKIRNLALTPPLTTPRPSSHSLYIIHSRFPPLSISPPLHTPFFSLPTHPLPYTWTYDALHYKKLHETVLCLLFATEKA